MRKLFILFVLLFFSAIISQTVLATPYYSGCSAVPGAELDGRSCVEIDQSDCDELPNRCTTLDSPNTYYILTGNIDVPRNGFEIGGDNIVFNLNDFTITYENTAEVVVPNHDFESGSANWDFSGAPSASVTSNFPAPNGYWHQDEVGNNVVVFSSPSAGEEILSDPINLEVGRAYTVSYMIYTSNYDNSYNVIGSLNIPILDGLTGCVESLGTNGGSRGNSAYFGGGVNVWGAAGGNAYMQGQWHYRCVFFVDQPSARASFRILNGFSGDVYVDAIEIKPAEEIGIYSPSSSTDVKVINGYIVQGAAKAYYSKALDLRGDRSEVYEIDASVYSPDSFGFYISGNNQLIHNNTITHDVKRTHNSHDSWYSNAMALGLSGGLYNSEIFNNSIPLATSGINAFDSRNLKVYNNSISLFSNSIHSYALGVRGTEDSDFYDNYVNNVMGSGIMTEAGSKNNRFNHNYLIIRDGPQEERAWTGKGLWARYNAGGNNFTNNTFIAYGGRDLPRVGDETSVAAVRIGGESDANGPLVFANNYVEAIMNDADDQRFGTTLLRGVAFDCNSDTNVGITKYIEGNTFVSNHLIITLGNNYADCRKAYFKNNKIIMGANPVPYFSSLYFGMNGPTDVTIYNTSSENGADIHDIEYYHLGNRDAQIGWNPQVYAEDSNNQPINDVIITFEDQYGTTRDTGTTGLDGIYVGEIPELQFSGTGRPATVTDYNTYTVTADNQIGTILTQNIDITSSTIITFSFPGGVPMVSNTLCEINNAGNWQDCSNLNYKDTLLGVSYFCQDSDGTLADANFTLVNIEDSTILASGTQAASGSSSSFTFPISQLVLNNSGTYQLDARCSDNEGFGGLQRTELFFPWGVLSPVHNIPATNSGFENGTNFIYRETLTCSVGECGTITATLDPEVELGTIGNYILEDTYSREAGDPDGYGTSGYGLVTGFSSGRPYRLWTKTDVTTIPSGAVINEASLWLYHFQDADSHVGATYNVYGSEDQNWNQGGAAEGGCYDHVNDPSHCPSIDATLSTGITPAGSDGEEYWQQFPLDPVWIQQQINSARNNLTIMIERTDNDGSGKYCQFRSKEYVDHLFSPKLIINYTDPSDKGGAVPVGSGNPFYTTSQNPQTCYLLAGDSCVLEWDVFPNGREETYKFYAVYDSDQSGVADLNGETINITIGEGTTCTPISPYDNNPCDGSIGVGELLSVISDWYNSAIGIPVLMDNIRIWKNN